MNRRQIERTLHKYANLRVGQASLLAQLRSMDRSRLKQATLGGDQESGFEQAFASLAYAYMREKVPQILDHMVGFQLLDRSEDNKKAVGVFGFFLEPDTWLYTPVFFLGGDLKGHELLYVQNKDAFVPLNEEWVNYILSRRPHVLGKPSVENISTLGGLQPSINSFKVPPRYAKYGSAHDRSPETPEWLSRFLPFVGAADQQTEKFRTKYAGLAEQLDLGNWLKKSPALLKAAWNLSQQYPAIKLGFDRFYGTDFFQKTATAMLGTERDALGKLALCPPGAAASSRSSVPKVAGYPKLFSTEPDQDPLETGELQLLKSADSFKLKLDPDQLFTLNIPDLTDEDREKMMKDPTLIRDFREPKFVSQAYNTQILLSLINPTDTGLYDVLVEEGKFERMLVISNPSSEVGGQPFLTLVRVGDGDGAKASMNADPSHVWAKNLPESDEEFRKWWGKLPEKKLSKDGENSYVAIGERGQGTVPFRVYDSLGQDTFEVSFDDYAHKRRPGYMPRLFGENDSRRPDLYGVESEYPHLIKINRRPKTQIRILASEVFIPCEYKFIEVNKGKNYGGDEPRAMSSKDGPSGPVQDEKDPPIRLGNLLDQQMRIFHKMASLTVQQDGPEYVLKFGHKSAAQRFNATDALFELVGQHGLKEAAAQVILGVPAGKTAQYRIRYAPFYAEKQAYRPAGGFLTDVGQMAPSFPADQRGTETYISTSAQGQYPYEETQPVPGLASDRTDPSVYDIYRPHYPGPLETAQQAAQSGQKEIFDTSTLSSLLDTVSEDKLFSEGIGDLIKAIDRLGRLRFSMLWHREEAEERYGRDTLPDLEDALVNAFESLGTVTLELKEKEVNPQIDLPSSRESLSAVSEN